MAALNMGIVVAVLSELSDVKSFKPRMPEPSASQTRAAGRRPGRLHDAPAFRPTVRYDIGTVGPLRILGRPACLSHPQNVQGMPKFPAALSSLGSVQSRTQYSSDV